MKRTLEHYFSNVIISAPAPKQVMTERQRDDNAAQLLNTDASDSRKDTELAGDMMADSDVPEPSSGPSQPAEPNNVSRYSY